MTKRLTQAQLFDTCAEALPEAYRPATVAEAKTRACQLRQQTVAVSFEAPLYIVRRQPVDAQHLTNRPSMLTAQGVFEFVRPWMEFEVQERLLVLTVNAKHRLLNTWMISLGGLTNTPVSIRDVFGVALLDHAWGVILVHNHPSGDPHPSREDRGVTRRVIEAGSILGFPLLDHVIVGAGRYVSLKEEGLIDWS